MTCGTSPSAIALAINVAALAYIAYRAKRLGVNPYKKDVFVGTKDYEAAMARADMVAIRADEAEAMPAR